MKVPREFYKSPKDLPVEEFLSPGSPLCAGCGGLTTLRLMHKILGGNLVIVNAAGCLTLMAVYPFTPLRSSWLYTAMGSASAGAQGLRDALDLLIAKGRLPKEDDLRVLVLAGDGSTYDMGLASTSAAIHRRLDFWYLCYDNEAYGVWPLKEAVWGDIRHTYIPNRFRPVADYLRPQRRFRHLFFPNEQTELLNQIQRHLNDYWADVLTVNRCARPVLPNQPLRKLVP